MFVRLVPEASTSLSTFDFFNSSTQPTDKPSSSEMTLSLTNDQPELVMIFPAVPRAVPTPKIIETKPVKLLQDVLYFARHSWRLTQMNLKHEQQPSEVKTTFWGQSAQDFMHHSSCMTLVDATQSWQGIGLDKARDMGGQMQNQLLEQRGCEGRIKHAPNQGYHFVSTLPPFSRGVKCACGPFCGTCPPPPPKFCMFG